MDRLDFLAPSVHVGSTAQFVELRHSVATSDALQVLGVVVEGTQAARFTRSADTCDQQAIAPSGTCRVTLSYAAPDTTLGSATLTFSLRQGTATFSRSVALAGTVSASAPAPEPASGGSGGGALGWGWLAGLAVALAGLRSTRA